MQPGCRPSPQASHQRAPPPNSRWRPRQAARPLPAAWGIACDRRSMANEPIPPHNPPAHTAEALCCSCGFQAGPTRAGRRRTASQAAAQGRQVRSRCRRRDCRLAASRGGGGSGRRCWRAAAAVLPHEERARRVQHRRPGGAAQPDGAVGRCGRGERGVAAGGALPAAGAPSAGCGLAPGAALAAPPRVQACAATRPRRCCRACGWGTEHSSTTPTPSRRASWASSRCGSGPAVGGRLPPMQMQPLAFRAAASPLAGRLLARRPRPESGAQCTRALHMCTACHASPCPPACMADCAGGIPRPLPVRPSQQILRCQRQVRPAAGCGRAAPPLQRMAAVQVAFARVQCGWGHAPLPTPAALPHRLPSRPPAAGRRPQSGLWLTAAWWVHRTCCRGVGLQGKGHHPACGVHGWRAPDGCRSRRSACLQSVLPCGAPLPAGQVRRLGRQIPLEELKAHGSGGGPLADMALLKYGR